MFYAIVAVIALILDQALKYWTSVNIVENTAGYTEVRPLIPGILRLTNFHNSGAAFSFLANASWARWFFVVLCLIFVAIVIYALLRDIIPSPGARWAAVFVMAGAIGNCIDRMITGYVVDMLEFDFTVFGHRFPVFNLADVYITVGAIVFVIFILILQQVDGNIIGPKILGDNIGLSMFWVLFAILIFGGFFGILGVILGCPVFGVIYYIVKEWQRVRLVKQGLPYAPEDFEDLYEVDTQTKEMIYHEKYGYKRKAVDLTDERSEQLRKKREDE